MSSIKDRVIAFIEENRISTEEVADCLNKSGLLKDARTICLGNYAVGEVQYVYGHTDSNWSIHEQIRYLQPDKILFVDAIKTHERALFGQLVSGYIIRNQKARAIITPGYMRDLEGLLRDQCKMWCAGITPIGCFNKQMEETPDVTNTARKNKELYEGSIAVCDDSGVVIIDKPHITEDFLNSLINMREQERIWFDCVDNRGWDTFDTVCLKKYRNE